MEIDTKIKRKDRVIFRMGDHVKITNAIFFLRCGYPLSFQEVREEIRDKYSDEISSFIKKIRNDAIGLKQEATTIIEWKSKIKDMATEEVVKDIAYSVLKNRRFGGNERTVHAVNIPELQNFEFTVSDKKVCYSGTYGHGGGGWGEDYEPNYLANVKAHVILYLKDIYPFVNNGFVIGPCYDKLTVNGKTYPLAIESCNVEKVK